MSDLQPTLSDDQRASYRRQLAAAWREARAYDGSETRYESLLATLIKLEEWLDTTINEGHRLGSEQEEAVSHAAGARRSVSIDRLIGEASQRLRTLMEKDEDIEQMLRRLQVVHEQIGGVLIPPGNQTVQVGDGTGEWTERRTEPRVQRLILALQQHGIFTDDLIVRTGMVLPTMMRRQSYALIEIPRIGREVLVCNEVGEATFVVRRHLGSEAYATKTKEELEMLEGVTRIVSPGLGAWEAAVIEELLRDVSMGEAKKVNVRDMEELRQAILVQCPTAAAWIAMTFREKGAFKVCGRGEGALATALGLTLGKNPLTNPLAHALLGRAIYGEGSPEIEEVIAMENAWQALEESPDALRQKIKNQYPTAAAWMQMKKKEKGDFKVYGRGEAPLATALGLTLGKDPAANPLAHALLGRAIYGEGNQEIEGVIERESRPEKREIELVWQTLEKDYDALRAEIRKIYPTAAKWIGMTSREKSDFKVCGRGEGALATALGLTLGRNPLTNPLEHALLGRAIYGEGSPEIEEVIAMENAWQALKESPDALRQKIKNQYPTAAKWIGMTSREKSDFKVCGRGEGALATALGLTLGRNPLTNPLEHALLGRAIYGEGSPEIEEVIAMENAWQALEESPDALRQKIKNQYPTAAKWIAMTSGQKRAFKVCGRGEAPLATALGLTLGKNPLTNPLEHALLGRAIYGEGSPEIEEVIERESRPEKREIELVWQTLEKDHDALRAEIRKIYPKAAAWMQMKKKEKGDFKVCGRGEGALATALGLTLKKNPLTNPLAHALLGRAIYGEGHREIDSVLSERSMTE